VVDVDVGAELHKSGFEAEFARSDSAMDVQAGRLRDPLSSAANLKGGMLRCANEIR
jgi:hypothetical protein